MLFNSIEYLLFFPLVVTIVFIIPQKLRYIWLLAASYYFYMSWNAAYGVLLLSATLVTYLSGLLLDYVRDRRGKESRKNFVMKGIVLLSLSADFGVLAYYKYAGFFLENLERMVRRLGGSFTAPTFDVILPIGISFFTFQTAGYVIDVYRGKLHAEKNPLRYALFVAFFPQLVAGPIERSENLLAQLRRPPVFHVQNVRAGLLTMAYGIFLKIVIADQIGRIVDTIYGAPTEYGGTELLMATILFAFQIYCDFNGYSKIAIGSAEVLGYRLLDNFRAPYLAGSVREFWKRWHISLTTWFTDYLYIPLGGGRKGTIRKRLNMFFVFLCSGLWHGAGWHYVLWGAMNGILRIVEDALSPLVKKLVRILKIDTATTLIQLLRRIIVFAAVDVTWLFFRAASLGDAIMILKKMAASFRWTAFINFDILNVFSSVRELAVIGGSLLILGAVDYAVDRGQDVRQMIFRQQTLFRWGIYIVFLMLILFWGAYGDDYQQAQFIYFQF